jgi:hypothetical protein
MQQLQQCCRGHSGFFFTKFVGYLAGGGAHFNQAGIRATKRIFFLFALHHLLNVANGRVYPAKGLQVAIAEIAQHRKRFFHFHHGARGFIVPYFFAFEVVLQHSYRVQSLGNAEAMKPSGLA